MKLEEPTTGTELMLNGVTPAMMIHSIQEEERQSLLSQLKGEIEKMPREMIGDDMVEVFGINAGRHELRGYGRAIDDILAIIERMGE